ncbi:MAG: MOSC domain-containing protein [Actinomycetota bacterium]|nr:MOSC domain-containing protein [Actinomycetota bacterium]
MESSQTNPMKVVSLNAALPSKQMYGEEEFFTGGAKVPVERAILRHLGFEGDGQGDKVNHGGPDKAVCVYPLDHYAHWQKALERDIGPGAFSENLTVSGAVETEVCIGDVFRVGEATVQVSMPRTPCGKLAAKNGERLFAKWVAQSGYTGFYMRVLSEGMVTMRDGFERIERHPDGIAISAVNDAFFERTRDEALIEHLSNVPEFGADGRTLFAERLERLRRVS